jgi:hypothetical protein
MGLKTRFAPFPVYLCSVKVYDMSIPCPRVLQNIQIIHCFRSWFRIGVDQQVYSVETEEYVINLRALWPNHYPKLHNPWRLSVDITLGGSDLPVSHSTSRTQSHNYPAIMMGSRTSLNTVTNKVTTVPDRNLTEFVQLVLALPPVQCRLFVSIFIVINGRFFSTVFGCRLDGLESNLGRGFETFLFTQARMAVYYRASQSMLIWYSFCVSVKPTGYTHL